MVITEEFLQAEITELEREMQKAQTFFTQAQATVAAYKMLIAKLNEPEPEPQNEQDNKL